MRRRVLLSAYSISPYGGSEAGIGWHFVHGLAKEFDVVVLCSPAQYDYFGKGKHWSFKEDIKRYERDQGVSSSLRFEFVVPPILSRLSQTEAFPMRQTCYYIGYAAWQREAYRIGRSLHRERRFDIAHQLTFTGYREPGYLWKLGCPFVWGPLTGAHSMPWAFLKEMSVRDQLFYAARNVVNAAQMRLPGRSLRAARFSSHIWVATEDERRMVCDRWGCDADVMAETGTTIRPEAKIHDYDGSRPLRLCWSGLHIGRKALPLLLRAMAKCPPGTMHLTVIGAGPESDRWRQQSEKLGLAKSVSWLGRLNHSQSIMEMSRADVFVLSSVHEGTPFVALEALSLGLPVVCHSACGMLSAITSECGVKIPLLDPETSVVGMKAALMQFLGTGEG